MAFAEPGGAVEVRPMVLDTVLLDVAAPLWAGARVFLSWRVRFEPDRFKAAIIIRDNSAGAAAERDHDRRAGRAA